MKLLTRYGNNLICHYAVVHCFHICSINCCYWLRPILRQSCALNILHTVYSDIATIVANTTTETTV